MKIGYRIAERFDASAGEAWTKYVKWSKLDHLIEVVGLDCALCPPAIRASTEADLAHAIPEWRAAGIFNDLNYVLSRAAKLAGLPQLLVLAVAREPSSEALEQANIGGFRYAGFDLIDEDTWISALTNCGGFDGAFEPSDLSRCGLIESPKRAYEIRAALRAKFPLEPHAHCAAWAIWRMEGQVVG